VVGFLFGEVWSRPRLDRRTKSRVTLAALATSGRTLGLAFNPRLALGNGVTRQEVVETLLHLAPYAGFPACWEGLARAQKVFRELDKARKAA
jgi:alkylhydroperoxidase/carboxymuconolactone decarboxylase family protein YurZ